MRVLVAEDDDTLRDSLRRGLQQRSFAVDAVASGDAALSQALIHPYDVIVLDVLMPGLDGVSVCRQLRERGTHTPILMLTARDAVADRIGGLDAGADDYLTKPFDLDELHARLRALLRRRAEVLPDVLRVEDLEVDTRRQVVTRGTRRIVLTSREYAFVEYLARNAGHVVSRGDLVAHVWDENHEPGANVIDVYMSRLRRKIDTGHVPLLHIRRGAGIMLGVDRRGDPA